LNRYLWPLLLLASALVVAASVLAVIGGGPTSRAVISPTLVDGQGQAASLDALNGRLRVVGLVGRHCPEECVDLLDRFDRLGRENPDNVEFVLLADDARLDTDARVSGDRGPVLHGREAELLHLFSEQLGFPADDVAAIEAGDADLLAAIVDAAEKVRGRYALGRSGDEAIWDRLRSEIDFRLSLSWRPLLHAWLNAISALLLSAGFVFIRKKKVAPHLTCMLLTTLASLVFLASYLYYHHHVGSMPFRGEGWVRTLYFTILLSHTVLAAVVPPLAATLLVLAARRRFDRHRRIARWTLPMWLYVSTTGVVIYLMLYVWFGPS